MAKPIGTLGAVDTLTIDGRTFANTESLIQLFCAFAAGAAKNGTFRRANASAGYTPSGSTKFTFGAIKIVNWGPASGATDYISINYSDVDLGWDSASAFTNPVYVANGAAAAINMPSNITTVGSSKEWDLIFDCPNGKYPGVDGTGISAGRFYVMAY